MTNVDQRQIIALLDSTSETRSRAVDAIQRYGLKSLITGQTPTVQQISQLAGLDIAEIRAGIDALEGAGRIETEGETVVGVGGLTTTETVHTVVVHDVTMHTWCALDAVGIPGAFRIDAQVSTTCPQCARRIHVTITNGEPEPLSQLHLFCPTGPCNNVRADFCAAANLFCDANHLAKWRATNPKVPGEALDLRGAVELGRAMWGRYRDDPA